MNHKKKNGILIRGVTNKCFWNQLSHPLSQEQTPALLLDFDCFARNTDYCVLLQYKHVAYQKKDEMLFFQLNKFGFIFFLSFAIKIRKKAQ